MRLKMTKLEELRKATHENTLRSRSIEAIVHSRRFERLWNESSDTKKMQAEHAIWQANKNKLIDWMKEHTALELGEQPLSFLRTRAKVLRVKNYSRLSKPELIREITNKENLDE